MATLTLDYAGLTALRAAIHRGVRYRGRDGRYHLVSSGSGGPDHRLIVNPSGRIACDCRAGVHGRACSHSGYLRAFLAWVAQRQREEATR
jgi:hypothetical protein